MKAERLPLEVFFAALEAAGLSGAEVARRLGVTRATISRWRSGVRVMSDDSYAALATLAFGSEALFRATHRNATGQHTQEPSPPQPGHTHRATIHITAAPDYRQKMVRAFRHNLKTLTTVASREPATWDFEKLAALAQEIAGMVSALRIVLDGTPQEDPCPDTPPAADAVK